MEDILITLIPEDNTKGSVVRPNEAKVKKKQNK